VYLPKRIEGGGPCDGSAPSSVTKILRSQDVGVLYPEIEQQLLSVQLSHPRGNEEICRENNEQVEGSAEWVPGRCSNYGSHQRGRSLVQLRLLG